MLMIGGMKQEQILELLGISRPTLFRFRKDPHWPGDDAPLELIRAFVSVRHKGSGRKAASPAAGQAEATLPDELQAEMTFETLAELRAVTGLDEEMKRSIIEKNKTQIRAYQLRCMEEHRRQLTAWLCEVLRSLAEDIGGLDLENAQLENLRLMLQKRLQEVKGEEPKPMQLELL